MYVVAGAKNSTPVLAAIDYRILWPPCVETTPPPVSENLVHLLRCRVLLPLPISRFWRSSHNVFVAVAWEHMNESELLDTGVHDAGIVSHSSEASHSSSARRIFDEHGQPTCMKGRGKERKVTPPVEAAAAAGVAAAISSGGEAAVTTALSTASGEGGSRCLDQQEDQQAGDGMAPLSPLRSVPTAPTSSLALGPAEVGGNGNCDDNGGLKLHHASALEDAEVAGLLDIWWDDLSWDDLSVGEGVDEGGC